MVEDYDMNENCKKFLRNVKQSEAMWRKVSQCEACEAMWGYVKHVKQSVTIGGRNNGYFDSKFATDDFWNLTVIFEIWIFNGHF